LSHKTSPCLAQCSICRNFEPFHGHWYLACEPKAKQAIPQWIADAARQSQTLLQSAQDAAAKVKPL